MRVIRSLRMNFAIWIKWIFGKKRARIGIYGPPNAGKTTLANRIVKEWSGMEVGGTSHIPHETRRAMRTDGVIINANGSSVELDIVDTPGTNAVIRHHERLTDEFIPRSDLVLLSN